MNFKQCVSPLQGVSENTDTFDKHLNDTHYQKMCVFNIPNSRTVQCNSLDTIDIIISKNMSFHISAIFRGLFGPQIFSGQEGFFSMTFPFHHSSTFAKFEVNLRVLPTGPKISSGTSWAFLSLGSKSWLCLVWANEF